MKPELTIQDFKGRHNSHPDQTVARLIKGGSWKKQRVIVILPAGDKMDTKVALSHWNLAFPPNNGVVRILAQGMEVGEAYSHAIESVLNHPDLSQWEYLLTLEHDNLPPCDGVSSLNCAVVGTTGMSVGAVAQPTSTSAANSGASVARKIGRMGRRAVFAFMAMVLVACGRFIRGPSAAARPARGAAAHRHPSRRAPTATRRSAHPGAALRHAA